MTNKQEILEKLFSADSQLPSLPVIYNKLREMLADPFISNRKIADVIMQDQAMVTKLLKLSNSALYTKREQINSLSNAITYLGTDTLKNLILQISLVKSFNIDDTKIPDFDITIFWQYSLGSAYFAELLAKKLKLPANDNYYLSGLLHSIGKLVIYHFYPDEFRKIVMKQISEGVTDTEAETEVLGVDHKDVGLYLAEQWKFNTEILETIKGYDGTDINSVPLVVSLVRIASIFAKSTGFNFSWDLHAFEIQSDPAWKHISTFLDEPFDIERITFEMYDECETIKDSVKDLLSD